MLAADGAGDGNQCIPGQLRATLPAGTSAGGSGTVSLGQTCDPLVYAGDSSFDRPMQMEFRAQGLLKFYRSDYQHLWGDNKGKYWFDADPGGSCSWAFGCDTNVGVEFTEESFWGRWFFFMDDGWLPDREVWVDTIVVKGSGTARRQRGPASNANMANYPCDFPPNWPEPCFTITGTQTVTLTPMATKLRLAASADSVAVGQPVTFTASTNDGTGFDVVDWIWVPDRPVDGGPVLAVRAGRSRVAADARGPTLSADPGPPVCVAPNNPCTEAVQQSGTMYVRAVIHWAAGTVEQASVRVRVGTDSLQLTPAQSTVMEGETIEFRSRTKGGAPYTVVSWTWIGASTPTTGDPLTSTASCGTEKKCKIALYESGKVVIEATIAGQTGSQRDTAEVTVTPCDTTGDKRLDSPGFRKGMLDLMAAMKQDGKEHGGISIMRPADGARAVLKIPSVTNNPCTYVPDWSQMPVLPPGWVRDTTSLHTHHAPGHRYKGCVQPGVKATDWVVAGEGPSEGRLLPDGSWSPGDWGYVVRSSGSEKGVTGYMIDGDGTIWRFNYPLDNDWTSENTPFLRQGSSACFEEAD